MVETTGSKLLQSIRPGGRRILWSNKPESKHPGLKHPLDESSGTNSPGSKPPRFLFSQNIDIDNAAMCACDLYNKLSGMVHNAVTSADQLYLVREHLSLNQLPFMVAISKQVVHDSIIKVISETEWRQIVNGGQNKVEKSRD